MNKAIQNQILQLEREQVRAINQGDVAGALKMFHKDFIGFSSTRHERIHGLGPLKKTFLYYLKRAPNMTYRIEQPQVHASGATAVATFYWTVGLGKGRRGRRRSSSRLRTRALSKSLSATIPSSFRQSSRSTTGIRVTPFSAMR